MIAMSDDNHQTEEALYQHKDDIIQGQYFLTCDFAVANIDNTTTDILREEDV
jgi:hypothetical protein